MPTLLTASGADWRLEVCGRRPNTPPYLRGRATTFIAVGGAPASIGVLQPESAAISNISPGTSIAPFIFEESDYDIYVFAQSETVSVTLPPGADAKRLSAELRHYTINFGSYAGFFEIEVSGTAGSTTIRLEVFPRKIDYRSDYVAIRDDISAILRNLAMAANAKTYGLASPDPSHRPTLVEWFALLQGHFQTFTRFAQHICDHPETSLEQREESVLVDRARRVKPGALARALRKGGVGLGIHHLGVSIGPRIMQTRANLNVDTPENRYVKAVLSATFRNLAMLSTTEQSGDEDAEQDSDRRFFLSIRPAVTNMKQSIARLVNTLHLRSVGQAPPFRPTSMLLSRHPVYAAFDRHARLLNSGLMFVNPEIAVGVKNTALLYEYWCFLKIVEILRSNELDLESQSVVRTSNLRLTVTLTKGTPSTIVLVHRPTGTRLSVVYNKLFSKLPTLAQQPDNVIQFSSEQRYFILDAKYRIQFDDDYIRNFGGIGPRVEDINTMHRYRDAIVIPHPRSPSVYQPGLIQGAIVLFPYADEVHYAHHRFFKSIEQVEIGGLPFLPKSTALVRAKLAQIIAGFVS